MILDTNALSAIADGERAAVRALSEAKTLELSVVVLGEYRFGIAQSRYRQEYEKWLNELIAVTRVLDVGSAVSVHYAEIRSELKKAGRPIPSNDLWIAATCRQHRLSLMSQDKHFDAIADLQRLSW